jgi:hypothetical protein
MQRPTLELFDESLQHAPKKRFHTKVDEMETAVMQTALIPVR